MDGEDLPPGWARTTLDTFLEGRGTSVDPAHWPDREFTLYSVPAHARGKPETLLGRDIGSTKQALSPGTVLLSKINPRINRVWITCDHGPVASLIGSTEWITFPPCGMLHPIYLKFFLMRENVRRYLMENVSGVGGSLTRVNSTVVGKIEIPLAPRPEQERIASAVDAAFTELDEAAAALARAREGMAQFRASLLHAACTGQLTAAWRAANPPAETGAALLARILAARRAAWERTECARLQVRGTPPRGDAWKARYVEPVAPDLTDLPDLPEGWAWASLDQLLSMMTSGSRAWAPYYDRGSGVFIMAQNVRPGRLDLRHRQMVDPPENDPERKRTLVSSNDILITIVGANTGDVCHVDRDLEDHFVCQSVALLRPVDASVAPYLTAYLVSPSDGRAILDQMAYGAGRPHLSFDQLKSMPIPMPSAAEQEIMRSVIAELTGELDTTTQIDQASALSVSLRQSILHAAFTGRLVPQDSEDEPAAALLARLRATAAPRRARLTHRV